MRKFVFALAFVAFAAIPAVGQRLPPSVTPTHYTLWFAPDLQNATFRGRETIDINVVNPTASVTLNVAEIQFGAVTMTSGGRTQTAADPGARRRHEPS